MPWVVIVDAYCIRDAEEIAGLANWPLGLKVNTEMEGQSVRRVT